MNDVTGDRRTHWREIIAGVLEWNYSHLRLESSSCFSIIVRVITFSLFKAKIVSPSQHRFKLWGFISFKAKSREKRLNISINSIMHAKSKKTLWFVFMLTFCSNGIKKGTEKGNSKRKLEFYYGLCVSQDLLHLRQTSGSLSIDECWQMEGQIPRNVRIKHWS